ncbi:MAG: preprotein translocase subunit SecG [Candidatus Portnoybacteria bacterium]|nr:preprotein translocase subunit SecG [Candidatus Portnoybacteria bacterium]
MLKTIIEISQIIISVILITVVLLQQRGSGSSAIMGGGGASYYTKRGFEKVLYILTIILGALFLVTALVNIAIH